PSDHPDYQQYANAYDYQATAQNFREFLLHRVSPLFSSIIYCLGARHPNNSRSIQDPPVRSTTNNLRGNWNKVEVKLWAGTLNRGIHMGKRENLHSTDRSCTDIPSYLSPSAQWY